MNKEKDIEDRIAETRQRQLYDLDLDDTLSGFSALLTFPPAVPFTQRENAGKDRRTILDRRTGDRRSRAREGSVSKE